MLELSSRHAFGTYDDDSVSSVVKFLFDGKQLEITSLNGNAYPLVSPDRKKKCEVGEETVKVPVSMAEEKKSWHLHFGHVDEPHRLLVFTRTEAVK